jgi:hypothetical protein
MAISKTGKQVIAGEVACLKKLQHEFDLPYLPRVLGYAQMNTTGASKIKVFLGEWFDAYHEFHLTMDPGAGSPKIRVWHPDHSRCYLNVRQTTALYRQIAKILTSYYNLLTYEQIYPWHHAAGDFVVKINGPHVEVRLITARNYASLFRSPPDGLNQETHGGLLLHALLIFLLNQTLRTRLDRYDGTGEILWSHPRAVGATLQGIFESLAAKARPAVLPDLPDRCMKTYLASLSPADLHELCRAILAKYPSSSEEYHVIKKNMDEHVRTLSQVLHII